MLIRQVNQKRAISVSINISQIKVLNFNLMSAMVVLNIHGADYCCDINGINKSEAASSFKNAYLTERSGVL